MNTDDVKQRQGVLMPLCTKEVLVTPICEVLEVQATFGSSYKRKQASGQCCPLIINSLKQKAQKSSYF